MTAADLTTTLKKNPFLVGCAVLSLALIIGIYLRSGAIDDANATLQEKSAEGQRYAQNLTNAVQLKEQLAAMTAANARIEARMIHASDLGINQQFFFKLESESGVKLADLRQGGTGHALGDYVPVTFNVAFKGDFGQGMAFLRALEDGRHYCRVQTAACSGDRKGQFTVSLTLELLGHP